MAQRDDTIYHNQKILQATSDDLVDKSIARQKRRTKLAKIASLPFVGSYITIFTIISLMAFYLLFPTTPLPYLITLGVAGFIVDGIMYTGDVRSSFAIIWGKGLLNALRFKGLFSDLKDFIVTRELKKSAKKNPDMKHFFDYVKKRAKEDIQRENPGADATKLKKLIKERQEKLQKDYFRHFMVKWKIYKKKAKEKVVDNYKKLGKYNRFTRGLNAANYLKNTSGSIAPIGRKTKNPLFIFGAEIEKINEKTGKEYRTKRFLLATGFLFVIVNAFGFCCMTITHILPLLTLAMSPTLAIMPVLGVGILSGFVFGLLMYKTLSNAIKKNIFKKIARNFGLKRDKHTPVWKHSITLIGKFAVIGAIGIVGSIAMMLMSGAWLDASMAVLGLFMEDISLGVNALVQFIMFGVIMPINILFSFAHSTGSAHKLGRIAMDAINLVNSGFEKWFNVAKVDKNKSFTDSAIQAPITTIARLVYRPFTATTRYIYKNPGKSLNKALKVSAYTVGGILTLGSLLIHLVVEASMTAGEGANSDSSWPGIVFKKITEFLHLDPIKTAITGSSIQEFLEHFDFIGKYFEPVSRPFYAWPKKIIKYMSGDDKPKAAKKPLKPAKPKLTTKQIKANYKQSIRNFVESYKKDKTPIPEVKTNPHFGYYHCHKAIQKGFFAKNNHPIEQEFQAANLIVL